MSGTFEPVWFREAPLDRRDSWIRHDSGELAVLDDCVVFTSRRTRVRMEAIKRVTQGRDRPDWTPARSWAEQRVLLDEWIRVDYGDGRIALLHDGRYRGWRGFFGGNRRIVKSMQHLVGR
jgi:hypothetical protein